MIEGERSLAAPVYEARELLCAAREFVADRAEAEDDVQAVSNSAQEERVQVVGRVRDA